MKTMIETVIIVAAIFGFSLLFVLWYTSLPIVERSHSTGECVEVNDPDNRYTCETVPDWPTLTTWVP